MILGNPLANFPRCYSIPLATVPCEYLSSMVGGYWQPSGKIPHRLPKSCLLPEGTLQMLTGCSEKRVETTARGNAKVHDKKKKFI